MNQKIIIVGGGISGIYCSILLKQKLNNVDVIVLESNAQPLKKLLSTGNGRCNLSNTHLSIDFYHSDCQPYIADIIHTFDIHELEDLGLSLTTINNLVYPRSEQALSVKRVLLENANNLGVTIITNQHVNDIEYINNQYHLHTSSNVYHSDYCILALGSNASKLSGSDNDRYNILKKLNLEIVDTQSSLCALNTKKSYPFKGVRVKGKVTLLQNNKEIHSETGELLFTDYGISGICVMQLSHYIDDNQNHYQVVLDMFHELTQEQLYQLLFNNKKISDHYLDGLVNTKIAEYFEKKDIKEVAHILKHFTFDITSKRDKEYAQVISGGLSFEEVNQCLEVDRYPHLYCLGELLNVNGMCGGYNIHFALSSAKRAANQIIRELC